MASGKRVMLAVLLASALVSLAAARTLSASAGGSGSALLESDSRPDSWLERLVGRHLLDGDWRGGDNNNRGGWNGDDRDRRDGWNGGGNGWNNNGWNNDRRDGWNGGGGAGLARDIVRDVVGRH